MSNDKDLHDRIAGRSPDERIDDPGREFLLSNIFAAFAAHCAAHKPEAALTPEQEEWLRILIEPYLPFCGPTPEKNGQPKRASIRELREQGFLFEINRQFLHPLGLALEVVGYDHLSGMVAYIGGLWDYRDDPEGMAYGTVEQEGEEVWAARRAKAEAFAKFQAERHATRKARLGFVVQPLTGDK